MKNSNDNTASASGSSSFTNLRNLWSHAGSELRGRVFLRGTRARSWKVVHILETGEWLSIGNRGEISFTVMANAVSSWQGHGSMVMFHNQEVRCRWKSWKVVAISETLDEIGGKTVPRSDHTVVESSDTDIGLEIG